MKLKITLFFILMSFSVNAKFIKATILFKNGELKEGYIKSFLERDLIDLDIFNNKLEKDLNLDDKTLKFKPSQDAEVIVYNIIDIKEVRIDGGEIFVALPVKTINKKGEFVDYLPLVWLPIMKEGKINIYAFQYTSRTAGVAAPDRGAKFYFQKQDTDFAVSPYEKTTLLSRKTNGLIVSTFYKYLFESCPEFYQKNLERIRKEAYLDYTKEEKKQVIEKEKAMGKLWELYYNNANYRTLENAFKLDNYELETYLDEFEKSNCQ